MWITLQNILKTIAINRYFILFFMWKVMCITNCPECNLSIEQFETVDIEIIDDYNDPSDLNGHGQHIGYEETLWCPDCRLYIEEMNLE